MEHAALQIAQASVVAGPCRQDLRPQTVEHVGLAKELRHADQQRADDSRDQVGLSLQQRAGVVRRVDLQDPQACRQATVERRGTVRRGVQSGAAQYPSDERIEAFFRGRRHGGRRRTARASVTGDVAPEMALCPRSLRSSDHVLHCCSSRLPPRDRGTPIPNSTTPRPSPASGKPPSSCGHMFVRSSALAVPAIWSMAAANSALCRLSSA